QAAVDRPEIPHVAAENCVRTGINVGRRHDAGRVPSAQNLLRDEPVPGGIRMNPVAAEAESGVVATPDSEMLVDRPVQVDDSRPPLWPTGPGGRRTERQEPLGKFSQCRVIILRRIEIAGLT